MQDGAYHRLQAIKQQSRGKKDAYYQNRRFSQDVCSLASLGAEMWQSGCRRHVLIDGLQQTPCLLMSQHCCECIPGLHVR